MDEVSKSVVILLHYGNPELTFSCIFSILKGSFRPDIILIDNDYDNRFFPFLSDCRSLVADDSLPCTIHYLKMSVNTGFSKGVNMGMDLALNLDKKLVLLLNNDTEVSYHFFETIIQESFNFYGITGVIEMEFNDKGEKTSKPVFAGGDIVWKEVPVYIKTIPDSWDISYKTDFIRGSFMAIPVNIIKKVGFFDESFFAYMEDVDYCIRAVKMGYDLKIVPGAVLWHRVSAAGDSYLRNYLMAGNYVKLLFKHAKGGNLFKGMILNLGSGLASLVNRKRAGKFTGFVKGFTEIINTKCS